MRDEYAPSRNVCVPRPQNPFNGSPYLCDRISSVKRRLESIIPRFRAKLRIGETRADIIGRNRAHLVQRICPV